MDEAIAGIGHNNPPEPTPFELSRDEFENLRIEAGNWLDGSVVSSEAEAEGVSKLLDMVRKAEKKADARRKEEAKPHDDAKAEIQARYNTLIGDTKAGKGIGPLISEACKRALTPWLQKLEDQKRAAAAEAQRIADEKAAAAREAMLTAQATDLKAREEAEAKLAEAQKAEAIAAKAAKQKAHASGGTRAIGLRSTFRPVLTDAVAAARHYWQSDRAALEQFVQQLAERDVRAGKREIPGFEVIEERTAA